MHGHSHTTCLVLASHEARGAGDWEARKERSVRVWHEWMPMRGGTYGESDYAGEEIWRSFAMGDLLKVVALEGRLVRSASLWVGWCGRCMCAVVSQLYVRFEQCVAPELAVPSIAGLLSIALLG